jgi:hypothetical protein
VAERWRIEEKLGGKWEPLTATYLTREAAIDALLDDWSEYKAGVRVMPVKGDDHA